MGVPLEHTLRVRYGECDLQGIVFNAHYLTYFDTTITEYFRALGYDQYADAKQTGEDFHVVKSVIEYKAPVRFDWELDVGARVARIGNSSLTFELAIFLKDGKEAARIVRPAQSGAVGAALAQIDPPR